MNEPGAQIMVGNQELGWTKLLDRWPSKPVCELGQLSIPGRAGPSSHNPAPRATRQRRACTHRRCSRKAERWWCMRHMACSRTTARSSRMCCASWRAVCPRQAAWIAIAAARARWNMRRASMPRQAAWMRTAATESRRPRAPCKAAQ